jgi:hypothetical protein
MTEKGNGNTSGSGTVGSNDQHSRHPTPDPSGNAKLYREVLTACNEFVNQYRKGTISKASAYKSIEGRLAEAIGDTPSKAEAAFGSFIKAIESHDSEVRMASERGKKSSEKRRAESPESDDSEYEFDDDAPLKKSKVDEKSFPWVRGEEPGGHQMLSRNLARTLELIKIFSVDPRATKQSLMNSPDCPEFPDSEWKNIIAGRAVNLDAVLSGQFSTSNNDVKTEKIGDLEFTFGSVEPTKHVENAGDWTIAWNRTIRATMFAFPHRFDKLANYGEHITSLFGATNPTFYPRIISFDKAVRNVDLVSLLNTKSPSLMPILTLSSTLSPCHPMMTYSSLRNSCPASMLSCASVNLCFLTRKRNAITVKLPFVIQSG